MGKSYEEYGRELYEALRYLDKECECILCPVVEEKGIGVAINDRLRRASSK